MQDWESLLERAYKEDIHPVCMMCSRKCKKGYSFWSGQMPPQEFCDWFKEGQE